MIFSSYFFKKKNLSIWYAKYYQSILINYARHNLA